MVDRQQRDDWAERLQNFLHRPSLSAVSEWNVDGNDRTLCEVISELQERLSVVLPVRPEPDIEQQQIDTCCSSIERTVLLLRSDHEIPCEPWTLENTWFPCSLGTGIVSLLLSGRFESEFLRSLAFIILGAVAAVLTIVSIGFYAICCWQIIQVRILRRDLTSRAVQADQDDFWPFESQKALQCAAAAFNRTSQHS